MHFHELDDALSCVCQAFLTLHDALQLLKMVLLVLALAFFLSDSRETSVWSRLHQLGGTPHIRYHVRLRVDEVAAMPFLHRLRGFESSSGHPALSRILRQLKVYVLLTVRLVSGRAYLFAIRCLEGRSCTVTLLWVLQDFFKILNLGGARVLGHFKTSVICPRRLR